MDDGVQARITQMQDAASNIKAGATKIKDAIEQTNKEIAALGPDRYVSPGAETFRASYARLTPQLMEAYDQLMQFQQRLTDAATEIQHAAGGTTT
jgi:uncharacterized protein YukE